jgi:hypothetical protein
MEIHRRITREFMARVFSVASGMGATRIALWLDWNVSEPDVQSTRAALQRFGPRPCGVEPVTRYDEDIGPYKRCLLYRFEGAIAKVLLARHNEISKQFDSISLYGVNKRKWTVGLVFHENLTVVRGPDHKVKKLLPKSAM